MSRTTKVDRLRKERPRVRRLAQAYALHLLSDHDITDERIEAHTGLRPTEVRAIRSDLEITQIEARWLLARDHRVSTASNQTT